MPTSESRTAPIYLTICYGHPSDVDIFDHHYRTVHRDLAQRMPGLIDFRLGACSGPAPDAEPAPYHLIAQLGFEDVDHLHAAMASPEGQAAAADLENFADGGVTVFLQQTVP
jgi:uncharacterized protein (TIGR02118 family)